MTDYDIKEIKAAGIEQPKKMTVTSLQPVILDHFPMLPTGHLRRSLGLI